MGIDGRINNKKIDSGIAMTTLLIETTQINYFFGMFSIVVA